MKYITEFRLNGITLLGACTGLALGSALNHYMLNLFGPALLAEFGWQKSQFALIGTLSLVSIITAPIAGRFVDRFGTRIAATIGFIAVPSAFLAFSTMSGNIYEFYIILLLKNVLGILTATLVFCRVIVERFDTARGLALSLLMSGVPLSGALLVPVIGSLIETEGWRSAYQALALISVTGGIIAILTMGKTTDLKPTSNVQRKEIIDRETLLSLLKKPVFLLLITGMLLVNIPQVLVSSQLKLVLLENNISSHFATFMVSVYAMGVLLGRFLSGIALDHIQAHRVALVTLGLPALGFIGLASSIDTQWLVFTAIAIIGLAQGAEGDIGAFLTSRKFSLQQYSFVYSFMISAIGAGAALGSLILSYSLHITDSFTGFLIIAAIATLLGAAFFFFTGRYQNPGQMER